VCAKRARHLQGSIELLCLRLQEEAPPARPLPIAAPKPMLSPKPQPLAPAQPTPPTPPTTTLRPNPPAGRGAASDARQRSGVAQHSVSRESPGAARVRPFGAGGGRGGHAGCRCRVAAGGLGGGPRRGARDAASPARRWAGDARRRPRAAAVHRLRRARVARGGAHAVRRLPRPRALVQRRVPAGQLGGPQGRLPGEEGGGGGGGDGGGRRCFSGVGVIGVKAEPLPWMEEGRLPGRLLLASVLRSIERERQRPLHERPASGRGRRRPGGRRARGVLAHCALWGAHNAL
jgi:hypothetical protein